VSTADEPRKDAEPPPEAIILSAVGILGWLLFILFYALYWSSGFSLPHDFIVAVVSLAIVSVGIGLMWRIWYSTVGERKRHQG
jgi:VIT1/CCC1 family predicted Fe2+/Mn2+ transporter